MTTKHTFALFTVQKLPDALSVAQGSIYTVHDQDVWHQVANVLRLWDNEAFTIFDGINVLHLTLKACHKKGIVEGIIQGAELATPLKPAIHLYQGLLKKESFEEVAYFAAQMGATSLTPVLSDKVQRNWLSEKDTQRLTKIMISACQQAKQFILPTLEQPITVDALATKLQQQPQTTPLRFEPEGSPLFELLQQAHKQPASVYALIIGTEGGFTDSEQTILDGSGIECYALTPTILRSPEAVAVALGTLRSIAR